MNTSPVDNALSLQLEQAKDELERIDLLNQHAWKIRRSYPQEAVELAMQAREIANLQGYDEGVAYSYRNTGTAYYLLSLYDLALNDLNKAILLFREQSNQHAEAAAIRNVGNIYHSIEENEKSLECYEQALTITEYLGDKQGTAYNWGNMGYVYQKIGEYEEALSYMFKTYDLLKEMQDDLGYADVCNNIGKTYLLLGQADKAYPFLKDSLARCEKIDHLRGIANAHTTLGIYYQHQENWDSSLTHFQAALNTAKKMGEKLLVSEVLRNISNHYELVHDFKNALAYQRQYEQVKAEVHHANTKLTLNAIRIQHELSQKEKETEAYRHRNNELARMKQELEEKNSELEKLSIVARETENVILMTDADGVVIWVNEAFQVLNNLSLEEMKAKRGDTIYDISNSDTIKPLIEEAIAKRTAVRYEALNNQTTDGNPVWESSTLTPIFDDKGDLSYIIIIDTDVTRQKAAEEEVRLKNKDITDSINYALRIQQAMLPTNKEIKTLLPDSFIFYRPKDIVSGDFYWVMDVSDQIPDAVLFAAVDCTGHGVPGAFMSMIGNSFLKEIVVGKQIIRPDEILNALREKVIQSLKQKEGIGELHDGMDVALCLWDKQKYQLHFAGANNPLYLIRDGELLEWKGDKQPVRLYTGELRPFTLHTIDLQPNDFIGLFSDGFADQFGGAKGKKFNYKHLKSLFLDCQHLPLEEQCAHFERTFEDWKGTIDQIDDILVMGVRVP